MRKLKKEEEKSMKRKKAKKDGHVIFILQLSFQKGPNRCIHASKRRLLTLALIITLMLVIILTIMIPLLMHRRLRTDKEFIFTVISSLSPGLSLGSVR